MEKALAGFVVALASLHVSSRQRFCVKTHQKRRAFRCFPSKHKPSHLHKKRETLASRQSLKRSIYRISASLSQDTDNMEQQKQLQSLTNEYQSLQNGMPLILTLEGCLSSMEMLILCRHEHFGHSTPKARKPAAREQGRSKSTTIYYISRCMMPQY